MKKFLPYILILGFILMVGFFGINSKAEAQGVNCTLPSNQSNPACTGSAVTVTPGLPLSTNGLENNLPACISLATGSVAGCIINIAYYIFFALPAFLMTLTAKLFDAMIPVTLSSMMYTKSSFIPEAWRIVRDFSNIFFILALLYTAIKVILSIDVAGVKKTVVQIIIAALLINFSMFMTQVVIDSSNILALIFYNKINIKIENSQNITPKNSQPVFDPKQTGIEEKSISYAIASSFNPTALMDQNIFKAHKGADASTVAGWVWAAINPANAVVGAVTGGDPLANYLAGQPPNINFYLALIFVSCVIFLVASYAFFIATLAFFGRLIELWMLIISSPFAFMSLSIPKLQSMEYIGFNDWLKRLISVAFMAPIFMFFILLISKLIQINPISNLTLNNLTPGVVGNMQFYILMIIPTMISLALLLKAVKFAKEGSGQFGELIIKYGQVAAAAVGGLAIGAATGGVGLAASATLGRAGAGLVTSRGLNDAARAGGISGLGAKALLNLGSFASKSSFDARKIGVIGKAMGTMGMKSESSALTKAMGLSTEGGIMGMRKRTEEKDIERAKQLSKVHDNEPEAVRVREVKDAQQRLVTEGEISFDGKVYSNELFFDEIIDKKITAAEIARKDAASREANNPKAGEAGHNAEIAENAVKTANAVTDLRRQKDAIANSKIFTDSEGNIADYTGNTDNGGLSAKTAKQIIDDETTANSALATAIAEVARTNADIATANSALATARADAARAKALATAPGASATVIDDAEKAAEVERVATVAVADANTAHGAAITREAELQKTQKIAEAMADAARAATVIDEHIKAAKLAEDNPHDAHLVANAAAAEIARLAAESTATTSSNNLRTMGLTEQADIVNNIVTRTSVAGFGRSISELKDDVRDAEYSQHHLEKTRMRESADVLANPSRIQKIFMPIFGDSTLVRDVRAYNLRQGAKPKNDGGHN